MACNLCLMPLELYLLKRRAMCVPCWFCLHKQENVKHGMMVMSEFMFENVVAHVIMLMMDFVWWL